MSPANTALDVISQTGKAKPIFSQNYTTDNTAHGGIALDNPNRRLAWYAVGDALALLTGFLLAMALAGAVNHLLFDRALDAGQTTSIFERLLQPVFLAGGILLWFLHTGHYRMRMPFWMESRKIIAALGFAMMADGFFQFANKQDASRLWLVAGWAMAAFLIMAFRAAIRTALSNQGLFHVRTLLVGGGETAEHIRSVLHSERGFGYNVTAHIKHLPEAFLQAGASWKKLCALHGADHIIIALDGFELASAERPLAQLAREHVPFSITPPLRHLPVAGMEPQYFFSHDAMLMTRSSGLDQPIPRTLKRLLDICAAGGALLILSPLMLILIALVKRDGGPAFFGHSRVGKDGKSFSCLKFRSMVMNGDAVLKRYLERNPQANKEWQETRKLQNDPRVTKLGSFIRKTSLDELPQLINVLRGDMSLVGPRPVVTAELPHYESDISYYYRVRPGITGLWQVSGRNDVTYAQRVQLDGWYVRNWSLWHDIAIICKTFPAIFQKRGAY
ncbi:MAG TPA: undecaprenyl-phosphate galactose phosphotransferase WbaP [Rickettsiales bacterium]|nr:undecaprenyl-phosphate galactose phosphotransferase WbaP [Rickettsiales bacterium]